MSVWSTNKQLRVRRAPPDFLQFKHTDMEQLVRSVRSTSFGSFMKFFPQMKNSVRSLRLHTVKINLKRHPVAILHLYLLCSSYGSGWHGPWKTVFLYKQGVSHCHVSSRKCNVCYENRPTTHSKVPSQVKNKLLAYTPTCYRNALTWGLGVVLACSDGFNPTTIRPSGSIKALRRGWGDSQP